ncbi:tail fiber assembly protein [Shewanella glacialipiscicola]|uniref:tail fiber assembly protein n=1 Tax=Shewanella glacialipiscicola TaxID=614069 RepID=UPI003D7BECC3
MNEFSLRVERTRLLNETDWTQFNDSPLQPEKVQEYETYRQALRDLPQSTNNPAEVVWPVKPE